MSLTRPVGDTCAVAMAGELPLRSRSMLVRHSVLTTWVAALALACAATSDAQQPASVGTRLVQVTNHAMRVQVLGLEHRGPGDPVVVFESGVTNALEVWTNVIAQLATDVPVVAYDRAGVGQSVWDSVVPTPRHVVNRLRQLLHEVGAHPPYLLVGHSWGGVLARYFAGYHPGDVTGFVFVDPAPIITESPRDKLAPFEAVGAGRAGYDAYWSGFAGFFAQAPPGVRAEFEVFRGLIDMEVDERDLRPLPDVPVAVLVAAEYLPPPPTLRLPYDPRAHFEADLRHRIRALQEWALSSSRGTLVLSNTMHHAVPREDPDLIVWAVRRVLQKGRP